MTEPGGNHWSVYVLDVVGLGPGHVYVGQSWNTREHRRQQHINGIKPGKVFKRPGVEVGELRLDLLPPLSQMNSREAAETAEVELASQLRQRGLTVHGGH